jgi:hypothetical protein
MTEEFKIVGEEYRMTSSGSFEAVVRSWGEVAKGFQAIGAEVIDYSKRAFENATGTFQQLIGAKSPEQMIEIQSQFAQTSFDTYVAQMSKLSELYVAMARDSSKPIAQAPIKEGT